VHFQSCVAARSNPLLRGDRHGPPLLRRLSDFFSRKMTAWQTMVITLLWLYIGRNFGNLVGLECPEPLANLYSRSYFRATWVTTALDAGFWTAMRLRPKFVRDFFSMVFSVYYLIAAEQADEKVRKVRGMLTLDHLRVSWNKPATPYLKLITALMRPRFMHYKPRQIRIARPKTSAYREPILAWLYYDGPVSDLKKHDKLILDVPGGGFVAMDPRMHDDKLMAWAGKTGLPVLSLDYRKAPEYPYPYALNECYDAYHTIVTSRGTCVGMSGGNQPRVILSGDSAGGNLAVGMLLMVLQAGNSDTRRWMGEEPLPLPESVVLIYPALDANIGNWMTDEQMALINDRQSRKTNRAVLSRKSEDYKQLTPTTPHHSDDEAEDEGSPPRAADSVVTVIAASEKAKQKVEPAAAHIPTAESTTKLLRKPKTMKTRLAMSSMISYFNDRILTPEMMRAMIILYIGPHHRPDFSTDFLLCPLLAPESLLARFPKTYILTGERDPLVDDTVIFAGRLRQAHRARHIDRQELGLVRQSREFRETDVVEVALIPGISHGFLQFPGIFPEGWKYIHRCSEWMLETFDHHDCESTTTSAATTPAEPSTPHARFARPIMAHRQRSQAWDGRKRNHFRRRTDSSGEEDRPLEMTRMLPNFPSKKTSTSDHIANGRIATHQGPSIKARRHARRRSLVSLASEDDLLGRRMKGLAGGLMGQDTESEPPPTP
jgi:acetyl esterase/lipase